jgi:hypothetical protein
MELLKEVVKTILLDNMLWYSSLEECVEHEFKCRIKTQKGIDSILELAEYDELVKYCKVVELDVMTPLVFYNTVIYCVARELIETDDVKFEFKHKFQFS